MVALYISGLTLLPRRSIMDKKDKVADKRKFKRFDVKEGAFAVLCYKPTIMGQIINMSINGLGVIYKGKRLPESSQIDMFIKTAGFNLEEIPVKTISDHKIGGKFPFRSANIWHRSIQFGELTDEQKSQLGQFLELYTSMIKRSEDDRRQGQDSAYDGPERRSGTDRRDETD
jgi:hypothetical protein